MPCYKMSSGKITIGTVCFLIDKKAGKVLLMERSQEPVANMMTGVGGKTEFHEDIHDSKGRVLDKQLRITDAARSWPHL